MKKILFGITSLTLGGAERVLVDLANKLCNEYEITIFTIYAKGELEKQLDKRIKLEHLYNVSYLELPNFKRKIIMPLKTLLFKKLIYNKKIRKDYNVEIAFLEGPITRILSCKNIDVKKVVWVHNDITKVFGRGIKAKIKKSIDKKVYKKYNKIIFVSKDNQKKFEEIYNLDNEKEVIYNYIDDERVLEKANEKIDTKFNKDELNIITVARLVEQKAIDRLVKIHSKLINDGLKHNFYVIGDGPEKEKIENTIKKYNVENSFKLLGKKENPYPYIKKADCFALLSYYEGYPMVLLEAQILNKYIIITDTAARETLQDYKKCMVLNNDEIAIYIGLSKLLRNKDKCIIENTDMDKYSNDDIIDKIKEVIEI